MVFAHSYMQTRLSRWSFWASGGQCGDGKYNTGVIKQCVQKGVHADTSYEGLKRLRIDCVNRMHVGALLGQKGEFGCCRSVAAL